MTPFGVSGSVQVSVIVVSVGSAVNPVGGEEAVRERERQRKRERKNNNYLFFHRLRCITD